jgi:hypothetical protein
LEEILQAHAKNYNFHLSEAEHEFLQNLLVHVSEDARVADEELGIAFARDDWEKRGRHTAAILDLMAELALAFPRPPGLRIAQVDLVNDVSFIRSVQEAPV